MVNSFQFSRLPIIHFGKGKLSQLPGIISRYGREIILVTSENSFTESSAADGLSESFGLKGLKFRIININGEPSPGMIDNAVASFSEEKTDVVVSIGGGSVMDAGKAVSAMLYRKESVKDYLEGIGTREHPGSKIPFIAVPTTSGTGSEVTRNAVLSETGRDGFKKSLRHDNFVPDIALIDPLLTVSCPKNVTAASGMDCFSQLTEAFLSDKACEYTDALAIEGLKAIRDSLIASYHDGTDIIARTGMSFAALTSGICLANAGLGTVHGFASSIGGMFEIPHGVVCGTLMASANEINVRELRKRGDNNSALGKYSALGRIFSDTPGKSDEYYIDAFIGFLHELTYLLELPRLRDYGIIQDNAGDICRNTEQKNNPVRLGIEALAEILTSRI
jgi:alcohol dehydrogenase class IV